ncbi:MAG: nucleoside triphosphate pyrophosphatase [Bdellovibrionota bacterium]
MKQTSPLILASTSKYRKELMERLQLPFQALKPLADEEALKTQWSHLDLSPQALAEKLAIAKAESLTHDHPQSLIIGSDQLVDLDGEILGKQPDFLSACAQLEKLSGRAHRLVTAVALAKKGQPTTLFTDITTLHFRKLTRVEIERYVEIEIPYDCAGTYKIEGLGIRLIQELKTEDPTAIIGLPLIRLSEELRLRGHAL